MVSVLIYTKVYPEKYSSIVRERDITRPVKLAVCSRHYYYAGPLDGRGASLHLTKDNPRMKLSRAADT